MVEQSLLESLLIAAFKGGEVGVEKDIYAAYDVVVRQFRVVEALERLFMPFRNALDKPCKRFIEKRLFTLQYAALDSLI